MKPNVRKVDGGMVIEATPDEIILCDDGDVIIFTFDGVIITARWDFEAAMLYDEDWDVSCVLMDRWERFIRDALTATS